MPVRRYHAKSRHGCVQCKARRTKCDETRPVCSKCQHRGTACSFRDDPNTLIFVDGPSVRKAGATSTMRAPEAPRSAPSPASPSKTAVTGPAPGSQVAGSGASSESGWSSRGRAEMLSPRSMAATSVTSMTSPMTTTKAAETFSKRELDNLRLLRYFQTNVMVSFTLKPGGLDPPETLQLWKDEVPDRALEYPFLLHAVLSMSAVFAALPEASAPDPNGGYGLGPNPPPFDTATAIQLADAHHGAALAQIGATLAEGAPLTMKNFPSLFVSACLVATFAFIRTCVGEPNPDPLGELSHVLTLLRGTGTIIRAGFAALDPELKASGGLEATPSIRPFMFPFPERPDVPLSPPAEAFLARLSTFHMVRFQGADPPFLNSRPFDVTINGPDDGSSASADARAYAAALCHLRNSLVLAREKPEVALVAVPFAVCLPETVLKAVGDRDPLALGLIAGYSVVLHRLRSHLWIRDWGRRVVNTAAAAMSERDRELMAWPLEMVGGDLSGDAGI